METPTETLDRESATPYVKLAEAVWMLRGLEKLLVGAPGWNPKASAHLLAFIRECDGVLDAYDDPRKGA